METSNRQYRDDAIGILQGLSGVVKLHRNSAVGRKQLIQEMVAVVVEALKARDRR